VQPDHSASLYQDSLIKTGTPNHAFR
jgi:hypothetical protein